MSTLAHSVPGGDLPDGSGQAPVGPPVTSSPATAATTNGPTAPTTPNVRPLDPQELRTLPLQALLVRTGALTIDQLSEALRENVATGRAVEEIAIERGWVPADAVERLVAAKQAATGEGAPAAAPVAAQPPAPAPAPAPAVEATPAPAPPVEPAHVPAPPVEPAHVPAPPVEPAHVPAPPVASAPAPAPVAAPAAAPAAAPPAAPASVAVEAAGEDADPGDGSVGVFLNLADGERVWVGRYASEQEAELRALEVVQQFVRPEPGVWPRIGGRFVRPEAVVSVELSTRRTP